MKIINLYSEFIKEFDSKKDLVQAMKSHADLHGLLKMAEDWEIDLANVNTWLKSKEYAIQRKVAEHFVKIAGDVVTKVEKAFGQELKGEIKLCPSLMRFDGFARYDSGSHTVFFGVDHPDADENYLRVLMAHELSHVYRDHQPDVWGFLGKPLNEISRQEYLDNVSAEEHLASEGLATLFSQLVFPEVPLHVHHYYFPEEMRWCLAHKDLIEKAIIKCLKGDQNVWKFYEDDEVAQGSPSRVQYFWGALKIREWLEGQKYKSLSDAIIGAHSLAAKKFECFEVAE